MDTFLTAAIIWLPPTFVFIASNSRALGSRKQWSLDWQPADQKWWHHMRNDLHYSGAAEPAFILKDEIETPRPLAYLSLFLVCATVLLWQRKSLRGLKTAVFWTLFATLTAMRCLSVFSGTLHFNRGEYWSLFWMVFPLSASCPTKGLFLHWLVTLGAWKDLRLGWYAEVPPRPEASAPADQDAPEVSKDADGETTEPPVTWRDAVMRLCWYHVIDNAVHVFWLRYGYEFGDGAPYTAYVNNSEILTMLLVLQLGAWTWVQVRMREEVALEAEEKMEEGGCEKEKLVDL
jgi:hypothetical protein